jgi:hypothetical protein
MRTLSVLVLASIGALAMPIHAQVVLSNTTIYTAPPGSFPAFGFNLALAESNGDGELDLYVADPQVDTDGRAYVLLGPDFTQAISVSIPSGIWGLGSRWTVGDLNGDNLADMALGGPYTTVGSVTSAGRALVSFAPGFQTTVELSRPAPPLTPSGDSFGSGFAITDFDGDGLDDLLVGAESSTINGSYAAGQIYVYSGVSQFIGAPSAAISTPFVGQSRYWGRHLAVADFNKDQHKDLITQSNLPLIGLGIMPSLDPSALIQFGPPIVTAGFGLALQMRIVDLHSDGELDIVASDPDKTGGGQVLVFSGPSFQNPTFLKPPGQATAAGSGYGLSHGDVDRDGTIDIVVGSPYDKSGNLTKNGRVTIFFGPDFVNTQSVYGQYSQSRFGQGVVVHDFDGDGYGEILVACGGEWGGGSLHLLQHESLSLQTANTVSLSAGGTVKFAIQRGKLAAGAPYLMLMSASGSTPGLQIPFAGGSVHLPLNFDAATVFGLQFVNSGVFIAFQGVLDTKGEAVPRFVVPGGVNEPALFGLPLTFAAVLGEAGPYISATTNAKVVTLGP